MSRLAHTLAALAVLFGCAPPLSPGLSDEVRGARAAPQGADSIALMRQQGGQFAHTRFVAGNQVDLLVDGPATFVALADAIRGARTRIDMESYEFDDVAGGQFADLLLWPPVPATSTSTWSMTPGAPTTPAPRCSIA